MAVFIDPDRFLIGLARTLRQRVIPALTDDSARFAAQMAWELLINAAQRRQRGVEPPDPAAAQAMAEEIRGLTREPPDAVTTTRLVELLHRDSRFYVEDQAAHNALSASEKAIVEEVFDVPTEAQLTEILQRWMGDRAVQARLTGRAVGGYSKQTLFIDLLRDGKVVRQLVMRRDLPFAASDRSSVTIEYPVAEPLFVESDPAVLKTPFLVSARVPGRLYGNSLGLTEKVDFDPEAMLGQLLAKLHGIDVSSLDLPFKAETGVAAQEARIDGWIDIYRSHLEVPSAALELGLAWLRANAHLVAGRSTLVHGDIGFHNILIDGGRVTALVDWELVHIANPVEDVAYVAAYAERPNELIEQYVAHGGVRPSQAEMTYFKIFAAVRNSIYGTVAMRQFNRGDHHDVSVLPIVLSSYCTYVGQIENELTQVISEHGFIWRST
jgi:aminoglycoside phosphotransferase (APT) family kinase protein